MQITVSEERNLNVRRALKYLMKTGHASWIKKSASGFMAVPPEGVSKSFSAFAREMYDGEDTIDGLFGEGTSTHKFFLYTNREGTKLRDVLVSKCLPAGIWRPSRINTAMCFWTESIGGFIFCQRYMTNTF